MAETYANFGALTTLSAAITTTGQTSITVASASGFPSTSQYRIRIDDEILLVTSGASTTTWTVTRGVEGTTAATHSNGASVVHVLTAQSLKNVVEARDLTPGAYAWNLTSLSSLILPNAAGAAPNTEGQIAFDTTTKLFRVYDSRSGQSGIPKAYAITPINHTLSAATLTSEQTFNGAMTFPANILQQYRVFIFTYSLSQNTTASPPAAVLRFKAGSTTLYSSRSSAPGTSLTNVSNLMQFWVFVSGSVGASAATYTNVMVPSTFHNSFSVNFTAQPVNLATNGSISFSLTIQYATAVASNDITLQWQAVQEWGV